MKYIDKSKIAVPVILITEGAAKTTQNKIEYKANSNHEFTFDSKIYGHKTVKEALKKIQNNTCCFCESKVTQVSYGDVEHFRPKGAFQQTPKTPLQKPGYFWLAYDWDNLLFACQICNSSYKKNLFPLVDEAKRAHNKALSIDEEESLIINPSKEDPSLHIGFYKEIPYGKDHKGKETIQLLGLDRKGGLNEDRLEKLNEILTIENMLILSTSEDIKKCLKELLDSRIKGGEYTLMYKTNFNKYL